jgi:HD-GYP domain-containing protein (c-di-GMP phosphodiesterase class II)
MLTTAWAGGRTADNSSVETQTSLPLSLATHDQARAALARAFEEAAVMPGTLLPHEILTELRDVAGRIVDEVLAHDDDHIAPNTTGPALYLVEHSIDATVLGLAIGRRLAPASSLRELGTGLFLQDIGKLALPPSLVHHPGPLAPDEWELMMQHTLLGLELLRDDTIPAPAKAVVRSHHERWDGSGYPDGLKGKEPPLFARIAAVADVFGAATSERFHAHGLSRDEGIELIRAGSASAFDPAVVEAFLDATGS